MLESSITTKGQVTIPVELREALNLHPGDKVTFKKSKNGVVIKKSKNDISASFGMYKTHSKITDKDIKKAIIKGASDDYR